MRLRPSDFRAAALAGLVVLALAPPAAAHNPSVENVEEEYSVASSFVVQGVFGFGVLLCATAGDSGLSNGACFGYPGHVGDPYTLLVTDHLWTQVSYTVAVDRDGNGCVSSSCSGMPNSYDYRTNACGIAISDVLPTVDPGVTPVLQVFVRLIDVDYTTSAVCGGSQGVVSGLI